MRKQRFYLVFLSEKQLIWSYMALVFIIGIILWRAVPTPIWTIIPRHLAVPGKRIIIDAGHGGRDPGAIGRNGAQEKAITLGIALELHRLFSQVGAYTVMIRTDDSDLADQGDKRYRTLKERDLWYRVKMANRSEADLYLSIHVNSFPQSIWSGAQTFYHGDCEQSTRLARAIQAQLALKLGPNHRKAKAADYRVLKSTRMPSVVVEVGFISNPREESLLINREYQVKLAGAIFSGVVDYLCAKPPVRPVTLNRKIGYVYPPMPKTLPSQGQVALYFADPNNEDVILKRELREIQGYQGQWSIEQMARAALNELGKGPGEHSALLPAAPIGQWLRNTWVKDGIATVNLSSEFAELVDGGGISELLAIYAVVNTLTELPGIKGVRFLIDGKSGSMLGDHVVLDQTMRRRDDLIKE